MTQTVKREKYEVDATGQAVGRLATKVATLLRGKNKPDFTKNIDSGNYVVVVNASQVKFTGRKLVQKDYHHHTMHPGGLKTVSMKKVFDKNPGDVIRHAVNGMLPKNKLRGEWLKRLTIKN